MSPHRLSTPEFENTVLTEFNAVLLEFCERIRTAARFDAGLVDVVITVVTVWSVQRLQAEFEIRARRILGLELAGARLDDVVLAVNAHLSAPYCQVSVSEHRRGPAAHPAGNGRPQRPVLVLTLAFERLHQFVFPLVATSAWLTVRRGRPAEDRRHEIPLPDHLNAVPAGALLLLRYWEGRVDLCRNEVKVKYAVQVDGYPLAPGQQIQLGRAGWIAYAHGPERAVLTYLLQERR